MDFKEARSRALSHARGHLEGGGLEELKAAPYGWEDDQAFRVLVAPADTLKDDPAPVPLDLPVVLVRKSDGAVSLLSPLVAMERTEAMTKVGRGHPKD